MATHEHHADLPWPNAVPKPIAGAVLPFPAFRCIPAACLLLLLGGCGKPADTAGGRVVAQVGSTVIREAAVCQLMAVRSGGNPGRFTNVVEREALLDELIGREAVYAKARAAGFDRRPDIQAAVEQMIVNRFREETLQPPRGGVPVTAEAIGQYYEAHRAQYEAPARARGAVIFLRVPATASAQKKAEFLAKAQGILETARQAPQDFGLLAQRHSEDQATRYRGGDIGWVTAPPNATSRDPALVAALLAVEQPGGLAPVVTTDQGFYVVKLLERQPVRARPLSEVAEGIRYLLTRQAEDRREQEFYAAMKAGLSIRINHDVLKEMNPPAAVGTLLPPRGPESVSAQIKDP